MVVMKKMYSLRREAVAFSLAGVVSLIALVSCGETVTWNTKQMFSGTTTLSDDIVLAGEVEVEVSKGTLTLSGSVSGSGAIRKTGSGTLLMAHADNGFKASSGSSIVVEAGVIQADATGAFGSGAIECLGNASIWLNSKDATFPNDMAFSGLASDSEACQLVFMESATISGAVVANQEQLLIDVGTSTVRANKVAKFAGPVDVGSGCISLATVEDYEFIGALSCGTLLLNVKNSYSGRQGTVKLYSSENRISLISMNGSSLAPCADNVLGGARYFIRNCQIGGESQNLRLGGFSQSVKALDFASGISISDNASYARLSSTSGNPVLTVTGDDESATTRCRFFNNNVQLRLNVDVSKYPTFVQTFSGPLNPAAESARINETAKPIDIVSGTLRLDNYVLFPSVPSISIGKNGVLQIGTVTNCLIGVSAITCEGRLVIEKSAKMPLTDGKIDLDLAESAVLEIPDGMTISCKSLTVDGERKMKGFYDASVISQIRGGGQVYADGETPIIGDATWTAGGGADTSIGSKANWGDSMPGLTSFETRAKFADAGTEATIDRAVRLLKLTLDAPSGFALRNGANGSLAIGGEGVYVAGKSEETDPDLSYMVEPFVSLYDAQDWTVLSGRTLAFENGFSNVDGAFVSVNGGGSLVWRGTNTLAATVTITNVPFTVENGLIASVDHQWEGEIRTEANVKAMEVVSNVVTLANGDIEKTIRFWNGPGYGVPMLVAKSGTTNEISGFVRQAGSVMTGFMVEENAELVLSGGYMCSSTLTSKFGSGALRIRSRNFGGEGGTLGFVCQDGLIAFEDGATLSSSSIHKWIALGGEDGSTASVEFCSDMACQGSRLGLGIYVSNNNLYDRKVGMGTASFHSTMQEVQQIVVAPLGLLTGDEGSLLRVVGDQDNANNLRCDAGIRGDVAGGLSIEMGGTGTLVLKGQDFSSTGELSVTNGTLKLAEDATWANGSRVSVGGNGKMVFGRGRGQLAQTAALRLSDNGTVEVLGSQALAVGSLSVRDEMSGEWRNLPNGIYSSKSTGALSGRIVSGRVRVGILGTVVTIR